MAPGAPSVRRPGGDEAAPRDRDAHPASFQPHRTDLIRPAARGDGSHRARHARSSARFSRSTFTRGSPMKPSHGFSVTPVTTCADAADIDAARARHASGLDVRVRRADMRIEAAAGGRDRIGGNRPGVVGILRAVLLDRRLHAVERASGWSGRSSIRPTATRRTRHRPRDGRGWKYSGLREVLADERRTHDLAVTVTQRPVRLRRKQRPARRR